jgi:hypothetical protein
LPRHTLCCSGGVRHAVSYVLPIRSATAVSQELIAYLHSLTELVTEVIVVDASGEPIFADFNARCDRTIKHVAVDPDLRRLANGKVAGVLTGVRLASEPRLVLADDDVRYDSESLAALLGGLSAAEIVRPQNYFDPLPWHGCLDTARILINRVTGGDWPGTFGLRHSALERTGGYDGDVLFENLELVRTVVAAGGRELRPLDLFVRRLPPRTGHFWSQRTRQAYDEFARPARLLTWLAVLPGVVLVIRLFGWPAIGAALAVPALLAEIGRSRAGGRRVFPLRATLVAPLWVLERAVCVWLAVGARLFLGGVPYHGRILKRAATPFRRLVLKHSGTGAGASGL